MIRVPKRTVTGVLLDDDGRQVLCYRIEEKLPDGATRVIDVAGHVTEMSMTSSPAGLSKFVIAGHIDELTEWRKP